MLMMYYSIQLYSIDDCKRLSLQQDLITLERWASLWQMEFNLNKCEYQISRLMVVSHGAKKKQAYVTNK